MSHGFENEATSSDALPIDPPAGLGGFQRLVKEKGAAHMAEREAMLDRLLVGMEDNVCLRNGGGHFSASEKDITKNHQPDLLDRVFERVEQGLCYQSSSSN